MMKWLYNAVVMVIIVVLVGCGCYVGSGYLCGRGFIRVVIFEMVKVCVRRMFRVGALDCIRMYRTYALIISSGNGNLEVYCFCAGVLCVMCFLYAFRFIFAIGARYTRFLLRDSCIR